MLADPCLMTAPERMAAATVTVVEDEQAIDRFLREVERRALRMAEFATRQREEALDLVQDAMFTFVRRYSSHPPVEWPPLFWRVLDSRIHDWHRRRRARGRWLGWLERGDDDAAADAFASLPDPAEPGPLARLADGEAAAAIEVALQALPLRQRQAFLLRLWEGLDVAATAKAMRCSEGSVKTHLSRALVNLRSHLEAHR